MLKQITRAEFCKKANVSEHDPMISCYINGEYMMPALGIKFYEDRDSHFHKYYVRNTNTNDIWRFSFSRINDGRAGFIDHWKHDDSGRFGGRWIFHKIWH